MGTGLTGRFLSLFEDMCLDKLYIKAAGSKLKQGTLHSHSSSFLPVFINVQKYFNSIFLMPGKNMGYGIGNALIIKALLNQMAILSYRVIPQDTHGALNKDQKQTIKSN